MTTGGVASVNVLPTIADHPAVFEIKVIFVTDLEDHSRFGLAEGVVVTIVVTCIDLLQR